MVADIIIAVPLVLQAGFFGFASSPSSKGMGYKLINTYEILSWKLSSAGGFLG